MSDIALVPVVTGGLQAQKQRDAERLIQRLEAILPGLGDAIELQESGTPAPTAVS